MLPQKINKKALCVLFPIGPRNLHSMASTADVQHNNPVQLDQCAPSARPTGTSQQHFRPSRGPTRGVWGKGDGSTLPSAKCTYHPAIQLFSSLYMITR